jgi:hypothetical protein
VFSFFHRASGKVSEAKRQSLSQNMASADSTASPQS